VQKNFVKRRKRETRSHSNADPPPVKVTLLCKNKTLRVEEEKRRRGIEISIRREKRAMPTIYTLAVTT
jgi:hypothetical protein